MAKYKETTGTGTRWTRFSEIRITNQIGSVPVIRIREEDVTQLDGEPPTITRQGEVIERLTAENRQELIPLLDPADGTPLNQDLTYRQLHIALYSLYRHLAEKRDNEPDPVDVQQPPQ